MTRNITRGIARDIQHLFAEGTLIGLSDSELLDRFNRRRDEEAFGMLVARHGGMVLTVCRRVTRDAHAAEDAFQATFLLLVRKARHVRGSLGGWFHRVAFRVAVRAEKQQARRRTHEQADANLGSHVPSGEPEPHAMKAATDLARDLHQEIARLDANHRMPVILCDLEGLTHEQAAAHLGWPLGTVKGRLARARERLRNRLERRGHALSTPLLAAALTGEQGAAVPTALVASTLLSACNLATHAAPLTASLANLVQGESLAMTIASPKFASIASVAFLGVVSAGWAAYSAAVGQEPSENRAAARQSESPGAEAPGTPTQTKQAREANLVGLAAPLEPEERIALQANLDSLTLDEELLQDALKELRQQISFQSQQLRHHRTSIVTGDIGNVEGGALGATEKDKEYARKHAAQQAEQLEQVLSLLRDDYRSQTETLQAFRRQKADIAARLEAPEPHARKLKPGDIVVVEVLEALPGRPITGERVVRPDGTIGLGFYGELRVAGLDRNQIKVTLIEKLRKTLSDESLGLAGQDHEGKNAAALAAESNRVFVSEDGTSSSPRDARIDALERKLDRVLSELEALKNQPAAAGVGNR